MLKFWIVTAKVQDPNIGSMEALLLRWGLISNGDGISDYLSTFLLAANMEISSLLG